MSEQEYKNKSLTRDYQAVFTGNSTAQQGLRVLFDLINQCNVFVVNTKNAHDSAVLEGQRKVGVYLMYQVAMAPQYGSSMSIENLANIANGAKSAKKYLDTIEHDAKQNKGDDNE